MPKGNNLARKAFSLIEVLIVTAIVSVLGVTLLTVINPQEQVKRGRDTLRLQMSNDLYNGIVRAYAASGKIPVESDIFGVSLGSTEAQNLVKFLKQSGELRSASININSVGQNSIYLSASMDGKTISVCFIPESKSYQSKNENSFDEFGTKTDCSTSTCHTCVGQTDESQIVGYKSQVQTSLCQGFDAECIVNSSEKACCAGLTCVPFNPSSLNGKCGVGATPLPSGSPNPTPKPSGSPSQFCSLDGLTHIKVKGRLIDRVTKSPITNGQIYHWGTWGYSGPNSSTTKTEYHHLKEGPESNGYFSWTAVAINWPKYPAFDMGPVEFSPDYI